MFVALFTENPLPS